MTQDKYEAALASFQGAQWVRIPRNKMKRSIRSSTSSCSGLPRCDDEEQRAEIDAGKLDAEKERRKAAEMKAQSNDTVSKALLLNRAQVLAAKNYGVAKTKFLEAGKIFKTDAVVPDCSKSNCAQGTNPAKTPDIPAAKTNVPDLIATGQAALRAKNWDAAEKALRSAGLVDPKNPAVVQGLRDVEQGRKTQADSAKSQTAFQQALDAGQAALTLKNYAGAVKAFTEAPTSRTRVAARRACCAPAAASDDARAAAADYVRRFPAAPTSRPRKRIAAPMIRALVARRAAPVAPSTVQLERPARCQASCRSTSRRAHATLPSPISARRRRTSRTPRPGTFGDGTTRDVTALRHVDRRRSAARHDAAAGTYATSNAAAGHVAVPRVERRDVGDRDARPSS